MEGFAFARLKNVDMFTDLEFIFPFLAFIYVPSFIFAFTGIGSGVSTTSYFLGSPVILVLRTTTTITP